MRLKRIIENLKSENLHEPEFETLSMIKNCSSKDSEFEMISQYSKFGDYDRKVSDLLEVSSYTKKKYKSSSFLKLSNTIIPNNKKMSLDETNTDIKKSQKKKSSVVYSKTQFENVIDREIDNTNEFKSDLQNFSDEDYIVLNELLSSIDTFQFNVFEVNDIAEKKSLYFISEYIFKKLNLFDAFVPEEQFRNFLSEIISGYNRNNTYHNDLHASDVLQTTYIMLTKGNLIEVMT